MRLSPHTARFLKSTRGRIVQMLREKELTVSDLARELTLTENAVRAHLATLERDGLARQSGERPGSRKPHFTYVLTPEAEELFPKAYATILNTVIGRLEHEWGEAKSGEFLREIGRDMAMPHRRPDATFEDKVAAVRRLIESQGGHTQIERRGGKVILRSNGCVLASVVSQHGTACNILTELIAQIVNSEVVDCCRRGDCPQCCFEIKVPEASK